MERYDVYLHNVPKVSEDGKVVPIAPHRTQEFSQLEEARKSAAEHKDEFDRVVVIRTVDDKQKMVERYMDGEHIVPEKEDEKEDGKEVEKED